MGNTSSSSSSTTRTGGYDSINDVVDIEINNDKSSSFLDNPSASASTAADSSNHQGGLNNLKRAVKLAGWQDIISRRHRLIIAIVVAFVLTIFFVRTTSNSGSHVVSTYNSEATATSTMNADAGADADADADADAAIIVSSEENPGGCRTTGNAIPHDSKKPIFQPFGEPMLQLDFTSDYYYKGAGFGGHHYFSTFDEAWQGCAKQCNWDPKCHTYTADISQHDYFIAQHGDDPTVPSLTKGSINDYHITCYLHTPYLSRAKAISNGNSYGGYVSGVCRLNKI